VGSHWGKENDRHRTKLFSMEPDKPFGSL